MTAEGVFGPAVSVWATSATVLIAAEGVLMTAGGVLATPAAVLMTAGGVLAMADKDPGFATDYTNARVIVDLPATRTTGNEPAKATKTAETVAAK
jgi:hypothetical protein